MGSSHFAQRQTMRQALLIFGCAVMYAFPEERMAEMACLAVNPTVQSQGDGERLLQRIEQRAREAGITRLFVLTTRTAHWFLKRGFVMGSHICVPFFLRPRFFRWPS